MARWDDGYVTDVAYTTNFYREITPAWLATTACCWASVRRTYAPFRYADLGCGNGFTALVVAATCPAGGGLGLRLQSGAYRMGDRGWRRARA